MSVGPLSSAAGLSGVPLAQARTAENTAQQETSAAERTDRSAQRAAQAGGIHAADAESEAHDRDADGRRPWQLPDQPQAEHAEPQPPAPPRDPHGTSGRLLDLSG
ncbi:MAG: hypothetical protein K6T86_12735 [Pirellulales bacterium]|nr:hypothetical protein [Pirellulales bacterium]